MLRSPKISPRFGDLLKELLELSVSLMTMICYIKMIQSKIRKGKGCMSEVQRKSGASIQEFFPYGFRQDMLNCEETHKMSARQSIHVFNQEAGHIGFFCHSTYQNSGVLEGKQVFSMHHIVCTIWAQGTAVLSEGMKGTFSKSKFPDASKGQPCQNSKDSRIGPTC